MKQAEPLARHCSWRVGGPADYFLVAKTVEVMKRGIRAARAHDIPLCVIGRGTNILVADAGVRGLVIKEACDGFTLSERTEFALVYAEAGSSLPYLANSLSRKGWAGLEWAVGVPSAVASAVVNNAGAHGSCIADVIQRVTVLGADDEEVVLSVSDMRFDYRHSRFKGQAWREVILSADFLLRRDSTKAIQDRLRHYNAYRRATQPSDPSAGSVFKNPSGGYAGALIESAELKGTRAGGAMVSPVHANFFVNTGSATAADLAQLIRLTQQRVYERSGIWLEPEIEFVGEWGEGGQKALSAAFLADGYVQQEKPVAHP